MKIRILTVGKIKESFWREAQAEFTKRLGPCMKMEIIEVAAEKLDGNVTDEEAMRREGERILNQTTSDSYVIAMDKEGKQMTSENFAETIEKIGGPGMQIIFVVGGSAGLHKTVLDRADKRLSLSEMTLPHELARIFLLEQIYRATQILKGGKYHR